MNLLCKGRKFEYKKQRKSSIRTIFLEILMTFAQTLFI